MKFVVTIKPQFIAYDPKDPLKLPQFEKRVIECKIYQIGDHGVAKFYDDTNHLMIALAPQHWLEIEQIKE